MKLSQKKSFKENGEMDKKGRSDSQKQDIIMQLFKNSESNDVEKRSKRILLQIYMNIRAHLS